MDLKQHSYTRTLTVFLHLFLWLGLSGIFCWVHAQFFSFLTAFGKSIFLIGLFSTVFYVNSYVLVNRFIENKKYISYSCFAVLLLVSSVILRIGIDRLFPHSRLPFQVFIAARQPIIAPVFMMFSWIVFSLFYQLLMNRYKRERTYLAQLNEFSVTQNEFLKSQINPHFLFNNLNNIYSLIQTGSPYASEMVLKLSDVLRYSIYKTADSKVRIKEEMEQVKNLINLYQLKENDALNITVDDAAILTDTLIEPVLLIPLIENCFKHGNILSDDKAFVRICVEANDQLFSCTVENSVAYPVNPAIIPGGVGLNNIKKRLLLMYGTQADLQTEAQPGLFKAYLIIRWKER
jgi:sensor histidine kinase YesM